MRRSSVVMTSVGKRLGMALAGVALAQVGASTGAHSKAAAPRVHPPPKPAPAIPAPADLHDQVTAIAKAFDGKAGIAIVSLRDGWELDWNAKSMFPQQSCSKLWGAITAMDKGDHGKVSLDTPVTIGKNDLTLFHQPIRDKVLVGGTYTT